MPTINELRATHLAAVNILQRAVASAQLTPEDRLVATDFLTSLAGVLPWCPVTVYKLEDGVRMLRLRDGRDPSQYGDDPGQRAAAHRSAVERIAQTLPAPPKLLPPDNDPPPASPANDPKASPSKAA